MHKYKLGLFSAIQFLILTVAMGGSTRADAAPVDAFQVSQSGTMAAGTEGLNLTFTVPTGKQLVIEYVAGNCFVPAGQTCVLSILTQVGTATTGTQFNLQTDGVGAFGGGNVLWRAGQQVKLYAKSGTIVTLRADRNSPTGAATVTFMSVSGYLE
ncbi:MAG: hypothetical protein ABSF86_19460 [Steroidobacteraceae bacterium]|jgi:hypothetical protein